MDRSRRIFLGFGVPILILVLTIIGVLTAARFHDGPFAGPLAIIAVGPFETGELQPGGEEPDWAFLREYPTIQFQLLDPARSRTTYIMEHDGRIFIPSRYMNTLRGKLWKHWPMEAEEDGRALLRVDGKLYERQLVRIQEPGIVSGVLAERSRKYGNSLAALQELVTSGDLWLFELQPRSRPQ
jgi:hypothetical protein